MPYNWNNGYDNTTVKVIDELDDDGERANTFIGTEWFAEFAYEGRWRVNPDWLAAQEPEPEQPTETPEPPVDEQETTAP